LSFDPTTKTISGSPVGITHSTTTFDGPDPSPDGNWIVFYSTGRQEDIYIARQDGTDLRKLTDDAFKDRAPRWTSDGKQIFFYSTRTGKWEIWSIRPDGSGLRRITEIPNINLYYCVLSPDQKRIATESDTKPLILDLSGTLPIRTVRELPPLGNKDEFFEPYSWSPDGKWLAGQAAQLDGGYGDPVVIYSLESGQYERFTEIKTDTQRRPGFPVWLKDSRTLLFERDGIFLVDREMKKPKKIYSPPSDVRMRVLRISQDNQSIFYIRPNPEGDIWLMTMK